VNTLTLEDQVGQLIIAVWPGDPEETAALVAQGRVGGLFIPAGAAPCEGELAEALERLQRLATYPLLCLGDAEGGLGPLVPGALALAAARRPDLARRAGAFAAAEARARGLQMVLAPPFDVQRDPGDLPLPAPSLGDNPLLVATLAAAFVEGCQGAGVLAVGRHFPGRGGALYDAGNRRWVLPHDRVALEKIDLAPFAEACRAGLGAIMSGHIHVPALDSLPGRLATHSSAIAEGLLRRSLRFGGLLITSNLDAPEVRTRYGSAEAAVLAFAAGHDLLVTEHAGDAYRALYEVLQNGDIPASRLEQAGARIAAARAWLRRQAAPARLRAVASFWPAMPPREEDALAGGPALARAVAQASLALLQGRPDVLPRRGLLVVAHRPVAPGSAAVAEHLAGLAAAHGEPPALHLLDAQPSPQQLEAAVDAASAAQAALLLLDLPPGHQAGAPVEATIALAQALKRAGLPLGVVVMGDPFPLAQLRQADLLLYSPGDTLPHLDAIFACLRGELEPCGHLPVHVPGLA